MNAISTERRTALSTTYPRVRDRISQHSRKAYNILSSSSTTRSQARNIKNSLDSLRFFYDAAYHMVIFPYIRRKPHASVITPRISIDPSPTRPCLREENMCEAGIRKAILKKADEQTRKHNNNQTLTEKHSPHAGSCGHELAAL